MARRFLPLVARGVSSNAGRRVGPKRKRVVVLRSVGVALVFRAFVESVGKMNWIFGCNAHTHPFLLLRRGRLGLLRVVVGVLVREGHVVVVGRRRRRMILALFFFFRR